MLGIDAAFDGMAGDADVVLAIAQRRAGRDADLLAHQVDADDHLGDRMLDLQPGVHLDEIELAVLVQELDGAGAAIADLRQRVGDDFADLRARLGVQGRRGRFLQHLLVAALQRAVALAQMHHIAVAVAQHLHLDMARLAEIFLDIDVVIAEGGLGLGAAERQRPISSADRPPSCRCRRRRRSP